MLEVVLPLKMQGTENESSLLVFQTVGSMVHKYFRNMHKWKCIDVYIYMYVFRKKSNWGWSQKVRQDKNNMMTTKLLLREM